jgi:hypothetical protein
MTLLGGAVAAWPLAVWAQQSERMRRIGVLLPASPDDPDYQTRVSALAQGLAPLGWNIGRNIRIDIRWARGDPKQLRRESAYDGGEEREQPAMRPLKEDQKGKVPQAAAPSSSKKPSTRRRALPKAKKRKH